MKFRTLLFTFTLFILPSLVLAVPLQIPYSGQLSESGTLVNGTRAMTFVIYDAASGGNALYTQNEPAVTVTNGVYHIELNAPSTVWTGADRWLGVSVNGGAELTPRTKIGSVPHAVRAGVVDNLPSIPSDPFPGSVLLNQAQKAQINTWIGNPFRSWMLCYRRSTHGSDPVTFHSQCNYRGPSVTVVLLGNGKLVGGYTSISWSSSNAHAPYDDNAFLFSLTAGKKYPQALRNIVVSHYPDKGPSFGAGWDLLIDLSNDQGFSYFPYSYSCNGLVGPPGVPDPPCSDEFVGVPPISWFPITNVEVWIQQ